VPSIDRFPLGLAAGLVMALALALLAAVVLRQADRSRSDLPDFGAVPAFELERYDGGTFTPADLLGKISVVDFIFTRCPNVCPVMATQYRNHYATFREAPEVQFVSITVDPDYDTPEVLARYAKRQGVTDGRWVFLRGPIAEVIRLSEQGFLLPAEDLPMGHSAKFALVDRQGRIRGYYDHDSEAAQELLKTHITELYRQQ